MQLVKLTYLLLLKFDCSFYSQIKIFFVLVITFKYEIPKVFLKFHTSVLNAVTFLFH